MRSWCCCISFKLLELSNSYRDFPELLSQRESDIHIKIWSSIIAMCFGIFYYFDVKSIIIINLCWKCRLTSTNQPCTRFPHSLWSRSPPYHIAYPNGRWCSVWLGLGLGLGSHSPCVTESVAYPPTGSMAWKGRWTPLLSSIRNITASLYLYHKGKER